MTAFGWKRKAGQAVCKVTSSAFEEDAAEEEDVDSLQAAGVDWLTLMPSRKVICLEDNASKSLRLREEGVKLASEERYWEALKKWDAALEYNPSSEKIHEMRAQAYMQLCEVYPAVQAAQKAVYLNPTWWPALQTLGRAQLGLGEVRLALRTFARAVHLHPVDEELWKEDLWWAHSLLKRKEQADKEKAMMKEQQQKKVKIVELNTEEEHNSLDLQHYLHTQIDTRNSQHDEHDIPCPRNVKNNYIQLRD